MPQMATPPIVGFHKGHGTDGEEHVHEGIETLDTGFIGIGHTQDSPESETLDILVIKTDSNGEEIWSKKIGAIGEWDVGIAIAESSDSFYAVGGKSLGGIQKPVIIKMAKGGEILWEKIFDTPGVGMLRGIDITQNGEVAVTGFHEGDEEGFVFISEGTGFAAVLDRDGVVVWQEDYEQIPQGTKILSTDNNGYAILSTVWNEEENNAAILKIGNSGEVQWFESYGGGNNQAFDFEYIPEEGYVLAGHTNSISAVNWDGLMTKVGTSGNLVWRKTVGQPRGYDSRYIHDEFYGIVVDSDGSYVMAGGTGGESAMYEEGGHPSGPSGEWKSYLVKINPNGQTIWEAVYGESNQGHNAAEFLDTTIDGGFILFNDSDTASISTKEPNNFGFMKLDHNASHLSDANQDPIPETVTNPTPAPVPSPSPEPTSAPEPEPSDNDGWTPPPPTSTVTTGLVEWLNTKTGEKYTTPTGGWTPPNTDWTITDPYDGIIESVRGKGKLKGTKVADAFTFDSFEAFTKKSADKIIGFNASQGDTIAVSPNAFPSLTGASAISFASTRSKKEFKQMSKEDYDFVYFEKKGRLYFDGNGAEKNWGNSDEGGLVAILKGKPELTAEDITLLA